MSGEKLFATSLFGFKKKHVHTYLEKMNKEYEEKITLKEKEITEVKSQYRDIKSKYDEINTNIEQLKEDRQKIANALITAQEKAAIIIDEAKQKALAEKSMLEKQIQEEKEKLIDIKKELRSLKGEVVIKLKKYEGELSGIVKEEKDILE